MPHPRHTSDARELKLVHITCSSSSSYETRLINVNNAQCVVCQEPAAMRFFVKSASGESHVVPCSDATILVGALKEAAVKRLCSEIDGCSPGAYRLVLAGTESVVSDQDVVGEVLQDGDCLLLQSKCSINPKMRVYTPLSNPVGANPTPEFSANCCGGGLFSDNLYGADSTNLPTYTLYPQTVSEETRPVFTVLPEVLIF